MQWSLLLPVSKMAASSEPTTRAAAQRTVASPTWLIYAMISHDFDGGSPVCSCCLDKRRSTEGQEMTKCSFPVQVYSLQDISAHHHIADSSHLHTQAEHNQLAAHTLQATTDPQIARAGTESYPQAKLGKCTCSPTVDVLAENRSLSSFFCGCARHD